MLKSSIENDIFYVHDDHLGSTDVISRSSSSTLTRLSYDAWGRRSGDNWTGSPSSGDMIAINATTDRGYTGEEQLDNLNLVHFNGRVYDPILARFMSADPFVQAPLQSQSFNRYSYTFNNPLNATDPTGFTSEPTMGASAEVAGADAMEEVVIEGHRSSDAAHRSAQVSDPTSMFRNMQDAQRNQGFQNPQSQPITREKTSQQQNAESNGSWRDLLPHFDLPSLPDSVVDFSAGLGDVLTFGLGDELRDSMGIGSVNMSSSAYGAGEVTGAAVLLATGIAGGVRAAGARGFGKEFSHWIPARSGGPRTILNGNFVTTRTHALSDPYRYRFMSKEWKRENRLPSVFSQQWLRIPNLFKGGGAGGAAGATGYARSGN